MINSATLVMFILPMILAMIPVWMDKMMMDHTIREDIGERCYATYLILS